MFRFFLARKDGSKLNKSKKLESLKTYIDESKLHPEKGNAFNILFSSDAINKYQTETISEIIQYFLSKGVSKFYALEFALLKKDYKQVEELFKYLKCDDSSILGAIKYKSLTLVQYFVEQKGADVNINLNNNALDNYTPIKLAAELQ